MGRRKKTKAFGGFSGMELDPETKRGIFILIILALGAVSLLSLFIPAGVLGELLKKGIILLFGWGRWFFPLILLGWAYLLYHHERRGVKGATYLGIFLFILSIQSLFHLFIQPADWQKVIDSGQGGGYVGMFLAGVFISLAGFWVSLLILICLFLISLMLVFNKPISSLFGRESLIAKLFFPFNFILAKIFRRNNNEDEEETEEEPNDEENQAEDDEEETEEEPNDEEDEDAPVFDRREVSSEPAFMQAGANKAKAKPADIWKPTHVHLDFPIDFLSPKIGKAIGGDIARTKEVIRQTFQDFGIQVEMGEAEVGPTVTRYTLKPAEGIKLSRITELNSNLALNLAARSIRIEAPISGKALVGIEVPNQTNAVVGLRELITSDSFKHRDNNMMLALGKDVAGKAVAYNLTETPHLLVAGATKSGKSVGINSMIMGLLYQNTPDELRFIMVDPKRVELPVYNGIPHLLCPVITDVPKTINALRWCLGEMDRRLDLMGAKGNKNIQTYNKAAKQKLPYIVVVVDELADLMLLARKDIEGSMIRLLQMSRAVGIHLILATQRPSADIITGLIKANMPARIAYAVNSGIDSRTVLDCMGAEKLLGRGDMLFTTAEAPKPRRLQGAYLSEGEIKKIIRYLKEKGGEPQYIEGITDKHKGSVAGVSMGGDNADYDDLLEEAKEAVINAGKAATSLLQRRLGVGYSRAAKLIDQLEELGVVGPANGSKPREVLISKEQYEAIVDQGVSGMNLHNREESEAPDEFLPDETGEFEANEEAEEAEDEAEDEDDDEKMTEGEMEDDEDDEDDEAEAAQAPAKTAQTKKRQAELDAVFTAEDETESENSEAAGQTGQKSKSIDDEDFDKLFSR